MLQQHMLSFFSSIALFLGSIYVAVYFTSSWAQRLVYSLLFVLFAVVTITFLAADYFTGNGIDSSVIFHLKYGFGGAGFGEYNVLIWLIILSILISLFLLIKVLRGKAGMPGRQSMLGLISMVLITNAFVLSPGVANILSVSSDLSLLETSIDLPGPTMKAVTLLDDAGFHRHYRAPGALRGGAEKKNLVYIYLESLEWTYFNQDLFPGLITELRKFEQEATTFTGLQQVHNTGWTIAGMTASQCGVPLVTASHGNSMSGMDSFLPGAVCMGDLLKRDGYNLSYMGGAALSFSGKGKFYRTHGFDSVRGRSELIQRLPDTEYVSEWGLYDDTLFEYAFEEYRERQEKNEPFGLFLLTLDTHHPNGHISATCKDVRYQGGGNPILNAVMCTDRMIADLVRRMRALPGAENTVFVIASDHLAMRNTAWDRLNQIPRHNLLMVLEPGNQHAMINDRKGSLLDAGATIMGFLGWSGNALGLGRDLRSDTVTLVEKVGTEADKYLKSWRRPIADFWNFPRFDERLKVDVLAKKVEIDGKRSFSYPILIELEENGQTTLKFDFNHSFRMEHESLADHVLKIDSGKPFVWIDECYKMRDLKPEYLEEGVWGNCIMIRKRSENKVLSSRLYTDLILKREDFWGG